MWDHSQAPQVAGLVVALPLPGLTGDSYGDLATSSPTLSS